MALRITGNVGMMVLAIWLILNGLSGFVLVGLPGGGMSLLALLTGILILIGR